MKPSKTLLNHQIRDPEVRLIDQDGKMIGVVRKEIALRSAELAGLDLIQVSSGSPPTCKILDHGKWKYQQEKAEKPQKKILLKVLFFRPTTGQHDIDVKAKNARRFLDDGHKVKLAVKFSGRELAHKDIGIRLLQGVIKSLEDVAKIDSPVKMEGKDAFAIVVKRE